MERIETIAVDLDGTLAKYDGWKGIDHIGEPIPEMVRRVKAAVAAGKAVVIFTARMADPSTCGRVRQIIDGWCIDHFNMTFDVTAVKRMTFTEFWDDRAVRVGKNTGEGVDASGTIWSSLDQ